MQHSNNESRLVSQSVAKTIIRMAIPMLAGTFALTMYQIANAWFVSRLGTEALAAISFTFPIVMLLMLVTRGLGTGAMTLVAHAIGESDHEKASILTTHALILSIFFAAFISIAGLTTIKPAFSAIGASGVVLDMTARYMKVFYSGAIIMVFHLVMSDIIVSTGNTKAVSVLMVGSLCLNIFLDMVLIFGRFGMPKMGIVGAAAATLLSEAAAMIAAFYVLLKRARLINMDALRPGLVVRSWGRILKFAIPGALGMVLTPISSAVITRLVAGYGNTAVAAMGVASRLEMFSFMIPATVGVPLIPFIAQNYGAKRIDRVKKARKGAMMFAWLYGIFIGVLLIIFAEPVGRIFSAEPAVIKVLCSYIYITAMGYGMVEVHRYGGFTMTGTGKPIRATVLNVIRTIILLIPLAIAGNTLLGLEGIFLGRLITDVAAGLVGVWWSGKMLSHYEE